MSAPEVCRRLRCVATRPLLLMLLVVALMATFLAVQLAVSEARAASEGSWRQTAVDVFPRTPDPGSLSTFSIADGSSRKTMSVPATGDLFESMGTWNPPRATYQAGDIVELDIQLRIVTYVRNAKDDGYIHPGLNSVGDNMWANIDVAGMESGVTAGAIRLADTNGESDFTVWGNEGVLTVPSAGGKVSGAMPAGYSTGDQIAIYVTTDSGTVRYTYTWVAQGDTTPTTVPATIPPPPTSGRTTTTDSEFAANDSGCRFGDLSGHVEVCYPFTNADGELEWPDEWNHAKLDQVLPYNTMIRTGERSGAMITFPDMSRPFVMKPDTCIILQDRQKNDSILKLLWGDLYTNAKHIIETGHMDIEMGQAVAGGRGTAYAVEERAGTSTVKVMEGAVEFAAKSDGRSRLVEPGEMLSATSAGLDEIRSFDAEAEQAEWDRFIAQAGLGVDEEGLPLWVLIVIIVVALLAVALAIALILRRRRKRSPAPRPYAMMPPPQTAPLPGRFPCPACGCLLSEGAKFCLGCGAPVERQAAPPAFCAGCGAPLAGTKFCTACGRRV